jgi:hypothetical protein
VSPPTDPDERERWQVAFERCEQGTCCPANSKYHRGRCPRRAAHLATRRERWTPEMETRSEIGGRRGLIRVVSAIALTIVLTMATSWLVVCR